MCGTTWRSPSLTMTPDLEPPVSKVFGRSFVPLLARREWPRSRRYRLYWSAGTRSSYPAKKSSLLPAFVLMKFTRACSSWLSCERPYGSEQPPAAADRIKTLFVTMTAITVDKGVPGDLRCWCVIWHRSEDCRLGFPNDSRFLRLVIVQFRIENGNGCLRSSVAAIIA